MRPNASSDAQGWRHGNIFSSTSFEESHSGADRLVSPRCAFFVIRIFVAHTSSGTSTAASVHPAAPVFHHGRLTFSSLPSLCPASRSTVWISRQLLFFSHPNLCMPSCLRNDFFSHVQFCPGFQRSSVLPARRSPGHRGIHEHAQLSFSALLFLYTD